MVGEGILRETVVPQAEGQAYALVDEWRPALLEAIGSEALRGQLENGHRLLLIGARDAAVFARAAVAIAADPVVLWAARVDGPARLLVVARGEDSSQQDQVDRLEARLADEGAECIQLRVSRVLELAELVGYAKTLAFRPPPPGWRASQGRVVTAPDSEASFRGRG
jgi:hypothetical protein